MAYLYSALFCPVPHLSYYYHNRANWHFTTIPSTTAFPLTPTRAHHPHMIQLEAISPPVVHHVKYLERLEVTLALKRRAWRAKRSQTVEIRDATKGSHLFTWTTNMSSPCELGCTSPSTRPPLLGSLLPWSGLAFR